MHWTTIECYNNQMFGAHFYKSFQSTPTVKPVPYFFITPFKIVGAYYIGREQSSKNPVFAVNYSDRNYIIGYGQIYHFSNGKEYNNLLFKELGDGMGGLYSFDYTSEELHDLFPIEYPTGSPAVTLGLSPSTVTLNASEYDSEVVTGTVTITDSRTSPVFPWSTISSEYVDPWLTVANNVNNHILLSPNSSLQNLNSNFVNIVNFRYTGITLTGTALVPTGYVCTFEFDVINNYGTAISDTVDFEISIEDAGTIVTSAPETLTINVV